jgi:cytochrome c553
MTARYVVFAVAAAAGLAPLTFVPLAQAQNQARQPDPKHGAAMAAQGTAAGAPACVQCHALSGGSDANTAFPRIAGQSAYYLSGQLRDFASGIRASDVMSPVAQALSPDGVADVAAYYEGVNAPFPSLKAGDPALIKQGEGLAKIGDAALQIQSCDNCHGPGGVGEPPAIPYLAGQYAQYIESTLQMWQQGSRKNSPEAMAVVAKKLDPQEVAAVAAYYQQVHSSLEAKESQGATSPGKD